MPVIRTVKPVVMGRRVALVCVRCGAQIETRAGVGRGISEYCRCRARSPLPESQRVLRYRPEFR